MKDAIFVIGHKNPDTDSIASAIAYSDLLRKCENRFKAIPARIGEINSETKFILDYFKVDPPIYIDSVEPTVENLKFIRKIPKIMASDPINKALKIMMDLEIGFLPIIDENDIYIGELTLSTILKEYMETLEYSVSTHELYYQDILDVLDGEIILGEFRDPKSEIKGRIFLDSRLEPDEKLKEYDIIITGTNVLIQMNAFRSGAKFFIITKDSQFLPEMRRIAEKNDCLIVKVKHDCFETIKLLNLIVPIKNLMLNQSTYLFHSTDYLRNVRQSMKNIDPKFQHFPVVDQNNKLLGMITRNLDYSPKKVILVDHNEISQSVRGINQANVIEVLDHHKLSDITSKDPIFVYCKPIGSTSTLIWERYKQENIRINKRIAGIMLGALLSDTLLLTSPTTTDIDRVAANVLADIAGVEISEFGPKMIEASTSIAGRSLDEIFNADLKVFSFKNRKFCISQINTTNYKEYEKKDEIPKYLHKLCADKDYEFAMVMLTDVVLNGSEIIFEGKRSEVVRKTFGIENNQNSIFLENVVSRKKQIVPPLLQALTLRMG
ncbi:MAG: putative manganese-dependent inorganic diphosphatase [Candidatus Lokiarchaeota archaeon]|nr:putative manganese-dependent inorganic diphosphatase [Candidatus Lokiarchaeota archaeon]